MPILSLREPVVMELAAYSDNAHAALTINTHRKARIYTTPLLPEGPFHLRNVEFLVFFRGNAGCLAFTTHSTISGLQSGGTPGSRPINL